jgi:hypothetical protein
MFAYVANVETGIDQSIGERATSWTVRFQFQAVQDCSHLHSAQRALVSIHFVILWIKSSSQVVTWQMLEANHSLPSSVEVKIGGVMLH